MPLPRKLLCVALLLAPTFLACPTTFGKGGTIDQAMLKDIHQNLRRQDCPLDWEEFAVKCKDPTSRQCPTRCRYSLEDPNE